MPIMGRLESGADLLAELTRICKDNNISRGQVEAIGAVSRATLGYYDQDSREYNYRTFEQHLEIISLLGNVSIKDGEPMVHAHVSLGDSEFRMIGGHLAAGTVVFACEYIIHELDGPELVRGYDEATGLPLWQA